MLGGFSFALGGRRNLDNREQLRLDNHSFCRCTNSFIRFCTNSFILTMVTEDELDTVVERYPDAEILILNILG